MFFLFCVVVFRFDSNQLALMGHVTVKGSLHFGVPVTWLGWEEGMFSQRRRFQKRPLEAEAGLGISRHPHQLP